MLFPTACQCQSIIFSVAKTARAILRSPQRRSGVTVLYRQKIDEKEMFLDIDLFFPCNCVSEN